MKTDEPLPELFPDLPPVTDRQPVLKLYCTKANYRQSCQQRWGRIALRDALDNWENFEELRETFTTWCEHYRRDPMMYVGQKAHNPDGTLTSMVYVMQSALAPDKSHLHPCLDFEEHFQTVFIRRGLLIYLTLLLQEAPGGAAKIKNP